MKKIIVILTVLIISILVFCISTCGFDCKIKDKINVAEMIALNGFPALETPERYGYYFDGWHEVERSNNYSLNYEAHWKLNKTPQLYLKEAIVPVNSEFDIHDYIVLIDENVPELILEVIGEVDTSVIGGYRIEVIVTDEYGLSTNAELDVIVNDYPRLISKDIVLKPNDYFNPLSNLGVIDASRYLVTYQTNLNTRYSGEYYVNYIVEDEYGFQSARQINVVVDNPPELAVEDIHLKLGSHFNYLFYASAYDFEEGDLTNRIRYRVLDDQKIDVNKAGTYDIEFIVNDEFREVSKVVELKISEEGEAPPNKLDFNILFITLIAFSVVGIFLFKKT